MIRNSSIRSSPKHRKAAACPLFLCTGRGTFLFLAEKQKCGAQSFPARAAGEKTSPAHAVSKNAPAHEMGEKWFLSQREKEEGGAKASRSRSERKMPARAAGERVCFSAEKKKCGVQTHLACAAGEKRFLPLEKRQISPPLMQ